ncbi:hypothetical protein MBLNU230_g6916t1 [Neophaeotheca triangularis]
MLQSEFSSAQALRDTLSALQHEVKKVSHQQQILQSLQYPGMDSRREMVRPTHEDTFQWIFDGRQEQRQETKYTRWLKGGQGIFWISGKPGSGKSTLMKYISNHTRTIELLRRWAGEGVDLVVASHYFWGAGTSMQKSQQGLLQSLMFAILRRCPWLIEDLDPGAGCHNDYDDDMDSHLFPQWNQHRLYSALEKLKGKDLRSSRNPVRFCFFIDGLDEYRKPDGHDHESHIMEVLEAILGKSGDIKLCVASRPWNAFERTLGGSVNISRYIQVQDYTKTDIEVFALGKIVCDVRFANKVYDQAELMGLVGEITEKAEGIFLWVALVVQELLRGLENHDDISDLQRRVRDIPPGLDDYYRDTFQRIDAFYRRQTAQVFLICASSEPPLPPAAFTIIDQGDGDGRRGLGKAELFDKALQARIENRTNREHDILANTLSKQLNGRCKDLLEVRKIPHTNGSDYRVAFLHRSVLDFLQSDEMTEILDRDAGDEFDPIVATACGLLLSMKKTFPECRDVMSTVSGDVMNFMRCARLIESRHETCDRCHDLVDELDKVMCCRMNAMRESSVRARDLQPHWTNQLRPFSDEFGENTFLAFAIVSKVDRYVAKRLLQRGESVPHKRGRPLLDYALRPEIRLEDVEPSASMVRTLLAAGASPNTKILVEEDRTPWELYLASLFHTRKHGIGSKQLRQAHLSVSEVLVRHGVSSTARALVGTISLETVRYQDSFRVGKFASPEEVFHEVFARDEAVRLTELMIANQPAQSSPWTWLTRRVTWL